MSKPLYSQGRSAVALLVLAASTLVGIAVHEGYKDEAYIPVPGDVPTIDFGRTKGVKMGDKSNPVRGLQYLLDEVENVYAAGVKRCVKVPLFQHEYEAMISISYNIGVGAFCNSTLVKKLNAGDYEGACNEFTKWVYVKGRKVNGLINRREQEKKQCLGELN
jgi:lysozyme